MENKELLKQVAKNFALRLKREVNEYCNKGFYSFEFIPIEEYSEEPTCVYTLKKKNFTLYKKDLLIDENGIIQIFCLENDWISPGELDENKKK